MKHTVLGLRQLIPFAIKSNNRGKVLEEFRSLHRIHGDLIEIKWPSNIFLVNGPELLKHILKTNQHKYEKSRLYKNIEFIFGQGLLNSENEVWKKSRSAWNPHFSGKALESFYPVIKSISNDYCQKNLEKKEINFNTMASLMALEVIDKCLLGGMTGDDLPFIESSLKILLKEVVKRVRNPIRKKYPSRFPGSNEVNSIMRKVDSIVYNVIDNLSAEGPLKQIRDGNLLDRVALRNEFLTLYLAGYETTANALTWSLYYLCKNPEWIIKIRNERRQVTNGADLKEEDLNHLSVLDACVNEAMRLMPPIPSISKTCIEDDEVMGIKIPAGSIIGIHQYVIQRDPRYWERPDEFMPQRFLGNDYKNSFIYLPFSSGKRACMGDRLALIEMRIFLSDFIHNYEFSLSDKFEFNPQFYMTLFNDGGLLLDISPMPDAV